MRVFEIIGNQPTITVEGLLIPEFKAIWNREKTKDKARALNEMCYIYFSTDAKSFYLAYDNETREEMIKKDYFGDTKWKPDQLVLDAIKKYKELQNTPTMRFLQANKNAMESMSNYFNNIDWDEADMNGKPKYDITKVSNAVKQAGGIIDNIDKLTEKVAKEQSIGGKARGQSSGGLLEMEEN